MSFLARRLPNPRFRPGRPALACAPAVTLALAGLCHLPAGAGPLEPLHLVGGFGYFHDDNLFRLSEDRPAFDGQRSDSARLATVGLVLDKSYSRQRLQMQARLTRVAFDHFSQLDYDGKDVLANLDWQIGNRLDGTAGASYAQTLAPYTDLYSRERNLRVQRRQFIDGGYRLHPSWRLRGSAARDKYTYELSAQRFNNRTEDAFEAGIDYLPRSGSTVGLVARRVEGKYLNQRVLFGERLDDSFEQTELKARINWKVTKISTISALAGYARRRHAFSGPDDASGFNGRVGASLQPRAKLRLNGSLWREFSAIESTLVSFSQNRGASAGFTWDATSKLKVDGNFSRERRAYEARLQSQSARDLSDTLGSGTLTGTWAPRQYFQMSTSFSHQRRRGAEFLGNGDFKANTLSLNANAQF